MASDYFSRYSIDRNAGPWPAIIPKGTRLGEMNNSLLSITHIVREHVVHIENERMSLSTSFGYHSMMRFHSSIEDEFLIDEFYSS